LVRPLRTRYGYKIDHEGEGLTKVVAYGSHPGTCPVRALQEWPELAGIGAWPVFRPINRHEQLGSRPNAALSAFTAKPWRPSSREARPRALLVQLVPFRHCYPIHAVRPVPTAQNLELANIDATHRHPFCVEVRQLVTIHDAVARSVATLQLVSQSITALVEHREAARLRLAN
jgi:hypothetical protein